MASWYGNDARKIRELEEVVQRGPPSNELWEETGISVEDIKEELYKGNIVLVPVNGRTIQNPYYTLPGPLRHMIMVIGYDPKIHTFITHDPGTKQGAYFLYQEDILVASLQNYATGLNEPIKNEPPEMLVIRNVKNLE